MPGVTQGERPSRDDLIEEDSPPHLRAGRVGERGDDTGLAFAQALSLGGRSRGRVQGGAEGLQVVIERGQELAKHLVHHLGAILLRVDDARQSRQRRPGRLGARQAQEPEQPDAVDAQDAGPPLEPVGQGFGVIALEVLRPFDGAVPGSASATS